MIGLTFTLTAQCLLPHDVKPQISFGLYSIIPAITISCPASLIYFLSCRVILFLQLYIALYFYSFQLLWILLNKQFCKEIYDYFRNNLYSQSLSSFSSFEESFLLCDIYLHLSALVLQFFILSQVYYLLVRQVYISSRSRSCFFLSSILSLSALMHMTLFFNFFPF